MPKFALLAVVAAATLLGTGPGRAWSLLGSPLDTAPWCVVYDIGNGVVQENCRMPSFAACNQERALQGGTAFCRQNPAFADYYATPRRPHKHRRHYR
jgi:hypothetical protein